jgi:hypothetical protein
MLSAVTLPVALTVRVTTTHLRYFTIEDRLDRLHLQALRKPVNRNLTPEQYFAATGEMASGNMATRDEIHLYMDQLFKRLLGVLAPFFINTPS